MDKKFIAFCTLDGNFFSSKLNCNVLEKFKKTCTENVRAVFIYAYSKLNFTQIFFFFLESIAFESNILTCMVLSSDLWCQARWKGYRNRDTKHGRFFFFHLIFNYYLFSEIHFRTHRRSC